MKDICCITQFHHYISIIYYFAGHGLNPLDIEFMQQLHDKVNIIPVISKGKYKLFIVRYTDRQLDGQTDKQLDGQIDKYLDRLINSQMDRQINIQID